MNKEELLRILFLLFLGQLLSLFLAVESFTSSLLANLGVDTPLTQSLFNYLALALVYGGILLCRREKLRVPWYWYGILALVDVQGNYLVVKAYQFSSITSVTLLDCFTLPWVIVLTWIFIGTRYSLWQFLGAALCLVGLVLVLISDSGLSGEGGKKPLLGDVLVIAGTVCYALSNVGEEFCVKHKDRVEVVAMLGAFGSLFSLCEILIFERKYLEAVKWSPTIVSLFIGFAASGFLFYSVTPLVLKNGGATLFNLSILTSDMWAILIRVFFYHQQINWLYYISFSVVAIGLIIYSLRPYVSGDSLSSHTVTVDEEVQYKPLTEDDTHSSNGEVVPR